MRFPQITKATCFLNMGEPHGPMRECGFGASQNWGFASTGSQLNAGRSWGAKGQMDAGGWLDAGWSAGYWEMEPSTGCQLKQGVHSSSKGSTDYRQGLPIWRHPLCALPMDIKTKGN